MDQNIKVQFKLSRLIIIALLLTLLFAPKQVEAQWPPFQFGLIPSYNDGKITYNLSFNSETEGTMSDVMIKLPLPPGTRFLSGYAQSNTHVSFDGQEVTFFTSVLHDSIRVASFTIEVIDPSLAVFTTHAWIAWKGDIPGDYLAEEVSLDITKPALNWAKPATPRLQLETKAEVTTGLITYFIYPRNVGRLRMWDLKITLPIPQGATFISAEAPPPFVVGFDGREASFLNLELAQQAVVEPLRIKVSTAGITTPFVSTYAWATWKNAGRSVGRSVSLEEQHRTGDIVVQPDTAQQVIADITGDVPFSTYDVTSVALAQTEATLNITFHTVEDVGQPGESLTFTFNINSDCTDIPEYQAVYSHKDEQAYFRSWNIESNQWNSRQPLNKAWVNPRALTLLVPFSLFLDSRHSQEFCWTSRAQNKSTAFAVPLPNDNIPKTDDLRMLQIKF